MCQPCVLQQNLLSAASAMFDRNWSEMKVLKALLNIISKGENPVDECVAVL